MNLIDRIRIRNNPNIIDELSFGTKLTDEVVSFAISRGYEFNAKTAERLTEYPSYVDAFKDREGFIDALIENTNKISVFQKLDSIYGREKTIDIIVSNESLKNRVINEYVAYNLNGNDLIRIVQGKSLEEIKNAIERYQNLEEFADYIVNTYNPQTLQEIGIDLSRYEQAYMRNANPEKIIELIQLQGYKKEANAQIKDAIKSNIAEFIPHLNQLDEICNSEIVDREIKELVITYLKENNIVYTKEIPEFALRDKEYLVFSIAQRPEIIKEESISEVLRYYFKNTNDGPEITNIIARVIKENHIKIDNIPQNYKDGATIAIYESIIKENPECLKERTNIDWRCIRRLTEGMSQEEQLEYLKSINYPFQADTVHTDNFLVVLECLKHDYLTLADFKGEYTLEQYKQIFEVVSKEINIEQALNSPFLVQNPYFIMEFMRQGVDLKDIDLEQTKNYYGCFEEIKKIADEKGIKVPLPKQYEDRIKKEEDGIHVTLNSLEDIRAGIAYMQLHGQKKLMVDLNLHGSESIIADNIEFVKQLKNQGIDIVFPEYEGLTLDKILEMEETLDFITNDIQKQNFSPLEQLVAVYDIVKNFKVFNDGGPGSQGRMIYDYWTSDHIVCAGYADLLANVLGHRLQAPYISIGVHASEPHERNYVNLVDEKYGIDGFYALDVTWDNSAKYLKSIPEERNSLGYNHFLMTTEEGRKEIEFVGGYEYDYDLTKPDVSYRNSKWTKYLRILDPEFFRALDDMSEPQKSEAMNSYFAKKINNPIPKDKILDAIMEVKRKTYVNFREQDFEDMRMQYSIHAFGTEDEDFKRQSLYGDKYFEYLRRRYEEIKGKTLEQAKKENPCLNPKDVIEQRQEELLLSAGGIGEVSQISISLTDPQLLEEVIKKQKELKEIGFSYRELRIGEEKKECYIVADQIKPKEGQTIEEAMAQFEENLGSLFQVLGIEREVDTQELGKQTLAQQGDTLGKKQIEGALQQQIRENAKEVERTRH